MNRFSDTSLESGRRPALLLALLAATLCIPIGCTGSDSTYATRIYAPDTGNSTSSIVDTGADANHLADADGSSDGHIDRPFADFPMSGPFVGSATLELPEGETHLAQVRATTSESAASFWGLLEIETQEAGSPDFEYVLSGTISEDDRSTVDLRLSERRCTSQVNTELCETDKLRDDPTFVAAGIWDGQKFTFSGTELHEAVNQPGSEFQPVLNDLTLEPADGFGPGGGRQAPTGGFRPYRVDAGDTSDAGPPEVRRLPEAEIHWQGRVTRGQFLDGQMSEPVDCEMTLDHADGTLDLAALGCGNHDLVANIGTSDKPRLISHSFRATNKHGRLRFATKRGKKNGYVFVANRQENLLSGLLLHDDDGAYNNLAEPVDLTEVAAGEVAAAFYLEADAEYQ